MTRRSVSANAHQLRAFLDTDAERLGFAALGVTWPDRLGDAGPRLSRFLDLGRHGSMSWMADTRARRADPAALWPDVRSVVMLAMNYGPEDDPLESLTQRSNATISVYARNRDYHDVVKGKLKELADRFAARSGSDVKVFVDTAPVMEKPLAALAGLGWQGKHTNLVSRSHGSWLFLGAIFTAAEIALDAPEEDRCGSCQACLDICPTDAFPAPYQLDARRCISYLTIENTGPIPVEFRTAMGNRVYGCDDCLAVCPWNKFARVSGEARLKARHDLAAPPLESFLGMDDAAFRAFFAGSPVKRIGRERFLRNVLIAAGNSADPALAEPCWHLTRDPSALIRGAAVWALSLLLPVEEMAAAWRGREPDSEDMVEAEWRLALAEQKDKQR